MLTVTDYCKKKMDEAATAYHEHRMNVGMWIVAYYDPKISVADNVILAEAAVKAGWTRENDSPQNDPNPPKTTL